MLNNTYAESKSNISHENYRFHTSSEIKEAIDGDESVQRSNRTISLDSRYILVNDQQQDLRGIMTFGKEMSTLRCVGLEYSARWFKREDSTTNRTAQFFLAELLPGIYLEQTFALALHEQGHGSRYAISGLKYKFDGGSKSFFPYFFHKLGKGNIDEGHTTHNDPLGINHSNYNFISTTALTIVSEDILKYMLLGSAGGLNTQTAYSEYIQNQIYLHGGNISMGLGMVINKAALFLYKRPTDKERNKIKVSSDLLNIERGYKAMGIKVDADDLALGGALAMLLSASTWNYFMSLGNFFETGDTSLSALEYRGFRIPDVSCYVTSRGLSMKVDTGYRITDSLTATLGVESVYKGRSATECTLGVQYEIPIKDGLVIGGYAITGYGKGYGFEGELKFNKSISMFLGGNYDEYKSLYGERNIVSLKKGKTCCSLFGGVRLNY